MGIFAIEIQRHISDIRKIQSEQISKELAEQHKYVEEIERLARQSLLEEGKD